MEKILLRNMHCKPTGMNMKQPVTPHWPLPHAVMHHHHPNALNNVLISYVPFVHFLHTKTAQVIHKDDMLPTFFKLLHYNKIIMESHMDIKYKGYSKSTLYTYRYDNAYHN